MLVHQTNSVQEHTWEILGEYDVDYRFRLKIRPIMDIANFFFLNKIISNKYKKENYIEDLLVKYTVYHNINE